MFGRILPKIGSSIVLIVAYSVLGFLLLAVGVGIYAFANLGRGPYEGVCFVLCEKNGC